MYSLIAAFMVMVVISYPSSVSLVQAFFTPSKKSSLKLCLRRVKRKSFFLSRESIQRGHPSFIMMETGARFQREELIEWQRLSSSLHAQTRKAKSSSFTVPVRRDDSGNDQFKAMVGENYESLERYSVKQSQDNHFQNPNSVNYGDEGIINWGDLMPSRINNTLRYVSDILPGFKRFDQPNVSERNRKADTRSRRKVEWETLMRECYGVSSDTRQEIRTMTFLSTSALIRPFPQKIRQDRFYFATKAGEGTIDQWCSYPSQRRKSSSGIQPTIHVTPEEEELFTFLRNVVEDKKLATTMRVAGGWVRDKLLDTEDFRFDRSNGEAASSSIADEGKKEVDCIADVKADDGQSKLDCASKTSTLFSQQQQPHKKGVDIDIALDNMVGREFAHELNDWLAEHGRETVSVGMMLKNPEKSKHLETATMKINNYWIDLVNLRTEAYAVDSRIPDQMGIGTAEEDAYRRDLTINSLFYNINTQKVEDFTGRGLEDLLNGVVSTPLPPLTTLLDDPLRVLRAVRFAARLGFTLDNELQNAAKNPRVHYALAAKVSRERVGAELDLMLQSKDPVGAMRLLLNLNLLDTVFPVANRNLELATLGHIHSSMVQGLSLLSTTHSLVRSFKDNIPEWQRHLFDSIRQQRVCGYPGSRQRPRLGDDTRLLWYAAFLKPLRDSEQAYIQQNQTRIPKRRKKAHRSLPLQLMIDDLKRCVREAEEVEKLQVAADEISDLILEQRGGIIASKILLSGIRIEYEEVWPSDDDIAVKTYCTMAGPNHATDVESASEQSPMWLHAMKFRLDCYNILSKIGDLWQEAFTLSMAEQLLNKERDRTRSKSTTYSRPDSSGAMRSNIHSNETFDIVAQYNTFASAIIELGLIGSWEQKPLLCGNEMKESHVLPHIPKGPVFREVMEEQRTWMTLNPCGSKELLIQHMRLKFPEFTVAKKEVRKEK